MHVVLLVWKVQYSSVSSTRIDERLKSLQTIRIWSYVSLNYIKQLGLKDTMHKRRRRAEMAFQINAMLVSPDTMTKEGGPHIFFF